MIRVKIFTYIMLFIPYPHVSVVLFYLCMPQNICMFLHLTANVLVCVYLDIYNVLHSFLQIPNSINHHFSLLWRTSVCISWGVSVKTYYLIVCLKISLFCFPNFKDNFIGYRIFGWLTDFSFLMFHVIFLLLILLFATVL